MSCFYVLELNPLSIPLFANMFSQTIGCLCLFVCLFVFYGFLCHENPYEFYYGYLFTLLKVMKTRKNIVLGNNLKIQLKNINK